jgi:hypothetical protein
MKIAIITSLPAKWNMDIDARQGIYIVLKVAFVIYQHYKYVLSRVTRISTKKIIKSVLIRLICGTLRAS